MDNSTKDKLIDHLTKEIEVLTGNIMSYRIRAAFTVWVGPYILLGSLIIATKGNYVLVTDNWAYMNAALIIVCAVYLVLGYMGGVVEQQAWKQCDKWRKSIADISNGLIDNPQTLYQALAFEGLNRKIKKAYIIVFTLILLSFWCIAYIASHVKTMEKTVTYVSGLYLDTA